MRRWIWCFGGSIVGEKDPPDDRHCTVSQPRQLEVPRDIISDKDALVEAIFNAYELQITAAPPLHINLASTPAETRWIRDPIALTLCT